MKRTTLITLILGTVLAIAPAAHAALYADGPSDVPTNGAVVIHTDVLGGNGMYAQAPDTTAALASDGVTLRPDILGGDGNASTKVLPTATGGDTFDWNAAVIGATTLAAVMLLMLASLRITRRRHLLGF